MGSDWVARFWPREPPHCKPGPSSASAPAGTGGGKLAAPCWRRFCARFRHALPPSPTFRCAGMELMDVAVGCDVSSPLSAGFNSRSLTHTASGFGLSSFFPRTEPRLLKKSAAPVEPPLLRTSQATPPSLRGAGGAGSDAGNIQDSRPPALPLVGAFGDGTSATASDLAELSEDEEDLSLAFFASFCRFFFFFCSFLRAFFLSFLLEALGLLSFCWIRRPANIRSRVCGPRPHAWA
mmetsp:Transcript_11465/g.30677  ORF Transcript_11465/g.30677 Transcript_11465/m.30677 type:complete len:236 (-) Transcript_11465:22-729(-)